MGKGTPETGRPLDSMRNYNQTLKALELILRPVDKNDPKSKSRLQADIEATREALLGGDPVLKGYYDNVLAGVSGDPSELPADMQNNILRDVRGSQAARGVLESDTSGIQEAVALLGGREQLRSRRLAQANQLLTSGVVPSMRDFLPSATEMMSAQLSSQQLRLQRQLGGGQIGVGQLGGYGNLLGGAGSLIGNLASSNSGLGA